MGWRIVSISSVSKLDYKMDYLVVRNQEGTRRIHLSEISVLLLESTAISLTAYLLCELNRNKIDVIFCDEKRCPYGMLASLYGSHDTSLKYRRQIGWTKEIKELVWGEIVRAKILGQAANLSEKQQVKLALTEFAAQILPGDPTNREGHAAKVYFNALFGMSFSRSMGGPINAIMEIIRKNKPAAGIVQALVITEKQYARMEYIVGSYEGDIINSDERFVEL